MSADDPLSIVPGLTIDARGVASVDASLGKLLVDLALQLEDTVNDPVDVEHVLASIALAARSGELDSETPLSDFPDLREILGRQLKVVFSTYQGRLGAED